MEQLTQIISQYGFPIVAAASVSYMVYYVWLWATTDIKPVLKDASEVLSALYDRINILDDDLIRLFQKVDVVMHLRGKTIERERVQAELKINKEIYEDMMEDEVEQVLEEFRDIKKKKNLPLGP